MDSAAVSRASQHGVTLKVSKSGRATYDEKGNRTGFITFADGCDVDGPPEARGMALADLEKFNTPAPTRMIEGWLAELSVIVARRGDDEFGDELRLSAYASRLARYPADISRRAILGERWKFWPTWYELENVCERLHSPRMRMMAALRRGPASQEPERRPATEDERARIQELVDQLFPNEAPDMRKAAVDEALKGDCMNEQQNEQP